jgi:hypothetical protein
MRNAQQVASGGGIGKGQVLSDEKSNPIISGGRALAALGDLTRRW